MATAGITGSPKATRANLITRMARMGQALPFKTVTPTISDSDETEVGLCLLFVAILVVTIFKYFYYIVRIIDLLIINYHFKLIL